jgi:arsenate reductase
MNELGIDIRHHRSNTLDAYSGHSFDFVINLCGDANERCPLFIGGVQRVHIGFDDPLHLKGSEDEVFPEYRRVRDEIRERFNAFLTGRSHE